VNVTCPNDRCTEYQVVKLNTIGAPVDEVICGACGGQCEPVPDESPT
jgi:hypothetical protein